MVVDVLPWRPLTTLPSPQILPPAILNALDVIYIRIWATHTLTYFVGRIADLPQGERAHREKLPDIQAAQLLL